MNETTDRTRRLLARLGETYAYARRIAECVDADHPRTVVRTPDVLSTLRTEPALAAVLLDERDQGLLAYDPTADSGTPYIAMTHGGREVGGIDYRQAAALIDGQSVAFGQHGEAAPAHRPPDGAPRTDGHGTTTDGGGDVS